MFGLQPLRHISTLPPREELRMIDSPADFNRASTRRSGRLPPVSDGCGRRRGSPDKGGYQVFCVRRGRETLYVVEGITQHGTGDQGRGHRRTTARLPARLTLKSGYYLIRRSRIHQIDIDVDELGAVVREHGGAEQAVGLSVDHDLDEACGLADFYGFAVPPHVEPGGLDPAAGFARGALGHADATEFWTGEDRIGYDPLGRARAVAGELRLQFPVIVPGGMGEHRPAADIARRPHPFHICREPAVDLDEAVL